MEPEVRNLLTSDFSKHRVRRSNGEVTIDGLYAEKSPGRFMVRVRVTGGRLGLDQALALADLADRHADGQWHADTRQNVELHGVPEADVVALLEALEQHGLTTRGACGDTVRNIVVGGEAGRFSRGGPDLYALADALTARFAGKPEFETLPRKFKAGLFPPTTANLCTAFRILLSSRNGATTGPGHFRPGRAAGWGANRAWRTCCSPACPPRRWGT